MRLVDLFSGCGGLSLGAQQAGFEIAAAFDHDPDLTYSHAINFPDTTLVHKDIAQVRAADLVAAAGGRFDGLIGGPPCQGFSLIGKRDPADPRRQLVAHFFRLVRESKPLFFVMENVPGLGQREARRVLEAALETVRPAYRLLGPALWDAARFGAATRRVRLFVIGVRSDQAPMPDAALSAQEAPSVSISEAIRDLGDAEFVGQHDGFDQWRIVQDIASGYARGRQASDRHCTGHRKAKHTAAVLARFAAVEPGTVERIGRYPRLAWDGLCPTLRAGTGRDRSSHMAIRPIHPEENRVITAREAARIQGFPDTFRFHPTVWHSFRMIGNSVSPVMSKAIFTALLDHLSVDAFSAEKQQHARLS